MPSGTTVDGKTIRIEVTGAYIEVFVDGVSKLDWTEQGTLFTGIGHRRTGMLGKDAAFDDFATIGEITTTTTGGTVTRVHHSLAGQTLGSTIDGEFTASLTDHLGSGATTITFDGTTITQAYTPFGMIRDGTGNSLPTDHTFTGQTDDPGTGLIDYNARAYDPQLGRFVMADTVLDGLNRYSYVHNNPVIAIDPTGHVYDNPDGSYSQATQDFWMTYYSLKKAGVSVSYTHKYTYQASEHGGSPTIYDKYTLSFLFTSGPYDIVANNSSSPSGGFVSSLSGGSRFGPPMTLSEKVHLGLDGAGMIPAIGIFADAPNVAFYAVEGDWVNAGISGAAAVPGIGIGAACAKICDNGARSATDSAFTRLAHSDNGINPYRVLQKVTKGHKGVIQAHHLIEKRFVGEMGGDTADWLTIVVTREEHQVFTNAWRREIPYGPGTAEATRESIEAAARSIYSEYPEILEALELD